MTPMMLPIVMYQRWLDLFVRPFLGPDVSKAAVVEVKTADIEYEG